MIENDHSGSLGGNFGLGSPYQEKNFYREKRVRAGSVSGRLRFVRLIIFIDRDALLYLIV